ncbi:MAG: hypothetical protein K6T85_05245, partial [Gorillibacterium sp.]|nr:hypothetical protein [Gorillibacterium sp.]
YETSLYFADGTPREDLGLGDVFGCTYTGIKKDAAHYGYQYIRGEHALTKGFQDTQLIANWGTNLLVRKLVGTQAEAPITFVPQIYPQSPERAWPKTFETDYPTCMVSAYGKGRAVYFPYGVDKQVWSHGHRDFQTVLGNAFDYLLGSEQKLTSNAPSSVHFTLNRVEGDENGYMLHAINTTSSSRRPVLDLVPVHDIRLNVVINGTKLAAFEVLSGLAGVTVEITDKPKDDQLRLHIRMERLEEYCGLYLRTSN